MIEKDMRRDTRTEKMVFKTIGLVMAHQSKVKIKIVAEWIGQ